MTDSDLQKTIHGCLLGAAIGDALGLPLEGLSKKRGRRMFRDDGRYHFLFGRGMVSDDTEHLAMVAQALAVSAGHPETFQRSLAWRMRFWLLGLPAGIGLATLRSLVKLWIGFSPRKSGVFSAGNGPAMRSAIIGLCFGSDPDAMLNMVRISTRITHTDPKAEHGAAAVALAAFHAMQGKPNPEGFADELEALLGSEAEEFLDLVRKAAEAVDMDTPDFAESLGLGKGVSGYMFHTLPVVLHAWFRHPSDLKSALTAVIRCGGDTDTTASILGGIVGAGVGRDNIPQELIKGLWDWPLGPAWLEKTGTALGLSMAENRPVRPPSLFFPAKLARNLFFMAMVLLHGFRRLFPPY